MHNEFMKDVALEFAAILDQGMESEKESIQGILAMVDKVAFGRHFLSFEMEAGHADPPEVDYQQYRARVEKRFPSLGYYNVVSNVSIHIGEAEVNSGNALDDIADIGIELEMMTWRWEHTSENDALWNFENACLTHAGETIRNLQKYLEAYANGY